MPQSARQLRKKPLQLARGAPQVRRPQEPACAGELQEKQQQPASAKKRPPSLSQCKSGSRPHQRPRCRPHPKPASPSKLPKRQKPQPMSGGFFPSTENRQPSLHQPWVIDSILSPGVRLPPRSSP